MRVVSGDGSTMKNFLVCTVLLINIVRMIKSRNLRWVGHVARRSGFKILTGTPTGKRPLGRRRCRCETILEWILKK